MSRGRVLVTGASGFVGRPAVAELVSAGWEVHTVSRRADAAGSGLRHHEADLLDAAALPALLADVRPTHLLHLAWYVEPVQFWEAEENLDWVAATLTLAQAFRAAGGKRFIGVGTCGEYGDTAGTCSEHSTPIRPSTLYGVCKAATCEVLLAWAQNAGVEVAWARLFHLFGPSERPGRLVSDLIDGFRAKTPVDLSAGDQVRDYLYVDDAAHGLAHLVRTDLQGPVNVGSGAGTSVRIMAERLAAVAGRPDLLRFGQRDQPSGPQELVADISRLKATGWQPRLSLDEALMLTWRLAAAR